MTRKLWPEFFMGLARTYAKQSTCVSGRRVGCVIARGNRQLSAGFNGVPSGEEHPKFCNRLLVGAASGSSLDLCPCRHAEPNAIEFAEKHGIDIVGADMYVTTLPCRDCIEVIKEAKIGRVFFDQYYHGSCEWQENYFIEPYQNEILRLLNFEEQCDYLLGLVSNVRGLEKISHLLYALPYDPAKKNKFIQRILDRSGLFPESVKFKYIDKSASSYSYLRVQLPGREEIRIACEGGICLQNKIRVPE